MKTLETLASSGNLDAARSALAAYAELFNRFYADLQRRTRVEEEIKASWPGLPIFIRIDVLAELAGFSLAHDDRGKALELVNEAKAMTDSASWQPRVAVNLTAKLAQLRFRAGDKGRARDEAAEALTLFDAKREVIVNIHRAEPLRSIAEAAHEMGDAAEALDLYRRALEAGIENPNSRPRAEDLTATCCSMALHAVEPGPQLLDRIREIRDGLGDPW
jgi:tetratricopeptide (TPR) repeat protein